MLWITSHIPVKVLRIFSYHWTEPLLFFFQTIIRMFAMEVIHGVIQFCRSGRIDSFCLAASCSSFVSGYISASNRSIWSFISCIIPQESDSLWFVAFVEHFWKFGHFLKWLNGASVRKDTFCEKTVFEKKSFQTVDNVAVRSFWLESFIAAFSSCCFMVVLYTIVIWHFRTKLIVSFHI